MDMQGLVQSGLNLSIALLLGAAIGFERQWRQRLAGIRTNTLVALGAAAFVVFSALYPGEGSPTRVAAQIVSGIGFLGAGIIFREGASVRGLNTAATLWCSAAVGMLAGAGAVARAALATALVIVVNLLLRPLVYRLSAHPLSGDFPKGYAIVIVCRGDHEAHVRALLLQGIAANGLHLRQLDSSNIESTDRVEVFATLATAGGQPGQAMEQIVGQLSLEPSVTAARWREETVGD